MAKRVENKHHSKKKLELKVSFWGKQNKQNTTQTNKNKLQKNDKLPNPNNSFKHPQKKELWTSRKFSPAV